MGGQVVDDLDSPALFWLLLTEKQLGKLLF